MSVYSPDPNRLYAAKLADGWYLMDGFGPLDGPYESARDVYATIDLWISEDDTR
jgi:hypothetical protein